MTPLTSSSGRADALKYAEPDVAETPTAEPLRVAVLLGSIRQDRFCPTPADWISGRIRAHPALEVEQLDLAAYHIPAALSGDDPDASPPEQITALGERLEKADGFIIVAPVYSLSYPGSLKTAIDWFDPEWQRKPVGFVSYGGTFGGMESVWALREVFAEFDAVCLSDSIAFPNVWDSFDQQGRPVDAERMAARASRFLDQFAWWAATLREGRKAQLYPANATG